MTRTCVASEYGVSEFSSTSCEPNIGRANLLSVESMMRIVSCLGTMLQMFFNYFTRIVLQKYFYRCDPKNEGARNRKKYENAQKKKNSKSTRARAVWRKKNFFSTFGKTSSRKKKLN